MGRKLDVDELVSASEIVDRLNLGSVSTVRSWRRRYADFPEPVADLAIGLVFHWPEIEAWARMTGSRREAATRPPKR